MVERRETFRRELVDARGRSLGVEASLEVVVPGWADETWPAGPPCESGDAPTRAFPPRKPMATPYAAEVTLRSLDGIAPVTAKQLRDMAARLDGDVDRCAAQMDAREGRPVTGTFTPTNELAEGPPQMVHMVIRVSDEWTKARESDYKSRRRRARLSDGDWMRYADAVNQALAAGGEIQRAVMELTDPPLSRPRAAAILRGLRERNLIPPSARSRRRSPTERES